MTEETKNPEAEKLKTPADSGQEEKKFADIPYLRFKEVNDKHKNTESELTKANSELQAFKDAEKKKTEDKLLEDKKYDELLKAKELEITSHKTEVETLKKNASLDKIRTKIVNLASKEGAVDSEDILRFISVDDLLELDSEKLSAEVKGRIAKIKEDKAHLFIVTQRDSRENGTPFSPDTSGGQSNNMSLDAQIEESIARSHKKR